MSKSRILIMVMVLMIALTGILVACDSPTYKLTVEIDGSEVVLTYDGETITMPTAPTKAEYVFEGWVYEDGTPFDLDAYKANPKDAKIKAKFSGPHHPLVKVDGVAPTFEKDGYETYWKCSECGKIFSGETASNDTLIEFPIVIPRYVLIYHKQVAPTVNTPGKKEYYEGTDGNNYLDESRTTKIEGNIDDYITIPKLEVKAVSEIPAEYGISGYKAHFVDEAGNKYLLGDDGKYVEASKDALLIEELKGNITLFVNKNLERRDIEHAKGDDVNIYDYFNKGVLGEDYAGAVFYKDSTYDDSAIIEDIKGYIKDNKDKTIYALKQYYVTLDAGNAVAPEFIKATYSKPIGELPIPEGIVEATFDRWYYASIASSEVLPTDIYDRDSNSSIFANIVPNYFVFDKGTLEEYSLTSFNGGDDATEVVVPAMYKGYPVSSIAGNAFAGKSKIVKVVLPDNITSIGEGAFADCTSLADINLPTALSTLNDRTFNNCTSLEFIELPANLSTINNKPFTGSGVKIFNIDKTAEESESLGLANGLTGSINPYHCIMLGDYEFERNEDGTYAVRWLSGSFNASTAVIPYVYHGTRVTRIREYALMNCLATEVIVPEGITDIEEGAFSSMGSLMTIELPSTLNSIGSFLFGKSNAVQNILIATNDNYKVENNAIIDMRTKTLVAGTSFTTSIPEGVEHIGKEAFSNLDTSITSIREGVLTIGESAFMTTNYSNPSLPSTLIRLEEGAFLTESLPVVYLPKGINDVTRVAFKKGTKIYYPLSSSEFANVNGIDNYLQGDYEVYKLGDWTFSYGVAPESYAISGYSGNDAMVRVPEVYYGGIDCTPGVAYDVKAMEGETFSGNTTMTSIYFGVNMTNMIDSYIFSGLNNLESIVVDVNNTNIKADGNCLIDSKDSSLIAGCKNSIVPEYVTTIKPRAFENITTLESVDISDKVTTIGDDAFKGCTNLTKVYYYGQESEWKNLITNNPKWKDDAVNPIVYQMSTFVFVEGEGFAKISAYNGGASDTVYVPDRYKGLPITTIIEISGMFNDIVLPESVRTINKLSLPNITDLVLPEGLEQLVSTDMPVFMMCSKLASITIPASVTTISEGALRDCFNLTNIIVDEANANFGLSDGALIDKNNKILIRGLATSTAPTGITKIGNGAYTGLDITDIIIPDGVTTIGEDAFYNCTNLKNITLPNTIAILGNNALGNVPNSLTIYYLGNDAEYKYFYDNNNTKLPMSVICNALGNFAYSTDANGDKTIVGYSSDMAKAETINISDTYLPFKIVGISSGAFNGLTSLDYITIGKNIKSIGAGAFENCTANIVYKGTYLEWGSIVEEGWDTGYNGYICNEADFTMNSCNVAGYDANATTPRVMLPPQTDSTSKGAIKNNNYIKSLYIPRNIIAYAEGMVIGCPNLESFAKSPKNGFVDVRNNSLIYSSVIIVGTKDTIIDEKISSIGESAFEGVTTLKSISLPDSSIGIRDNAFKGCTNLEKIYYYGTQTEWNKLVELDPNWKGNDANVNPIVYYMNEFEYSISSYDTIEGYKDASMTSTLYVPDNYKGIPITKIKALRGNFNNIEFPNTITHISGVNSPALTRLDLSEGLLEMGLDGGFGDMPNLQTVTIPASVNVINKAIFGICPKLTSIVVHEDNKNYYIDGGALIDRGTKSLLKATDANNHYVPEGVTQIYDYAYAGLDITYLDIRDGVFYLGPNTFSQCMKLDTLIFPTSLREIGKNQFDNPLTIHYMGSDNMFDEVLYPSMGVWDPKNNAAIESLGNFTYGDDGHGGLIVTGVVEGFKCPREVINIMDKVRDKSVTAVGDSVFMGLDLSGQTVSIALGVESIGSMAFALCTASNLNLPASVNEISRDAFFGANIKDITIDPSNTAFAWVDNIMVKTENNYAIYVKDVPTQIVDNKITDIGFHIMSFKKNIRDIAFYGAVNIERESIVENESLEEITFSNEAVLGNYALAYNNKLAKIYFHNPKVTLSRGVFAGLRADIIYAGSEQEWADIVAKCPDWEVGALVNVTCSKQYEYTIDEATHFATITKYIGSKEDVTVPDFIDGTEVRHVGANAFKNNTTIKKVAFAPGIETIGAGAFMGCTNLQIVDGFSSTIVEADTFNGCTSLTNFGAKGNVNEVKDRAFLNCGMLGYTTVKGLQVVGNNAFENCVSVYIDLGSLTTLGVASFKNCISLRSAIDLKHCTTIPNEAFSGCAKLTVYFYENKYIIGDSAFEGVRGEIRLSYGQFKSIGNRAFFDSSIIYITIHQGASIGENAFGYCNSMREVTLEGNNNVASNAFANCNNLQEIVIGPQCSFGDNVFSGIETRCVVDINSAECIKTAGIGLFDGAEDVTINFNGTRDEWNTIISNNPHMLDNATVNVICPSEFELGTNNNLIKYNGSGVDVVIPQNLDIQRIDAGAFRDKANMASVIIPFTVTEIGDGMFSGCTSLAHVYYDGTKEQWDSMTKLVPGWAGGTTPTVEFAYMSLLGHIYEPVDNGEYIVSAYEADSTGNIVIPSRYHGKPVSAVKKICNTNANPLNIVIEEGVKTIYEDAIDDGTVEINSISIPASVTKIYEGALGLAKTHNIILAEGNTVYKVDNGTLVEIATNTAIKAIFSATIPNYITTVGSKAYANNNQLELIVPSSVESVHYEAFYNAGCNTIVLNEGLKYFGDYALESANAKVEDIKFPSTIEHIGANSIYIGPESGVLHVTLGNKVSELGDAPFGNTCDVVVDYLGSKLEWDMITKNVYSLRNVDVNFLGEFSYEDNGSGGYIISGYRGQDANIILPETHMGKQVTGIKEGAFADNLYIVKVMSNELISTVPNNAFKNCTNLVEFSLEGAPNATIGDYAFDGCVNLQSVGSSIIYNIGKYAFRDTAIQGVQCIGPIGEGAFYGCTNLSNTTIADNVANYTYYGCTSLHKVTFSIGCNIVGASAFENSGITYVGGTDKIASYGLRAFYGTPIESIHLYNSTLGNDMLANTAIKYVNFSGNSAEWESVANSAKNVFGGREIVVIKIGEFEFVDNNESVNRYIGNDSVVYIPKQFDATTPITKIKAGAFASNTTITDLYISKNITQIEDNAFEGATMTIHYEGSEAEWNAIKGNNNVSLASDYTYLETESGRVLANYKGDNRVLNIADCPGDVISITGQHLDKVEEITFSGATPKKFSKGAFANFINLQQITIPKSVEYIDSTALPATSFNIILEDGNSNHTYKDRVLYDTVNDRVIKGSFGRLPDTAKVICSNAYSREILPHIQLPDSVTTIEDEAFINCHVSEIVLGKGVLRIGDRAFKDGQSPQFNITINNRVEYIGEEIFSSSDHNIRIELEYLGTKTEFDNIGKAFNWADGAYINYSYAGNFRASDGALTGYYGKERDIVVPTSTNHMLIQNINSGVFNNNQYVETIYIPNTVSTIDPNNFINCPNLRRVYYEGKKNILPDTLTNKHSSIDVVAYGDFRFVEYYGGGYILTQYTGADRNVVIPEQYRGKDVVAIGGNAFDGSTLSSVSIPGTVTKIESNAFINCASLKKVRFEQGDAPIDFAANVFVSCPNIKHIVTYRNVKAFGSSIYEVPQDKSMDIWYMGEAKFIADQFVNLIANFNGKLHYDIDPNEFGDMF